MLEVYKKSRFKNPKFLGTLAIIEGFIILFLLFYSISITKNNGEPLTTPQVTEQPQPSPALTEAPVITPVPTEAATSTPQRIITPKPTPIPTPVPTPELTPDPVVPELTPDAISDTQLPTPLNL